jgi:hypothetical protein
VDKVASTGFAAAVVAVTTTVFVFGFFFEFSGEGTGFGVSTFDGEVTFVMGGVMGVETEPDVLRSFEKTGVMGVGEATTGGG